MAEEKNNEQLNLMRAMAELARERTTMAKKRTEMSAARSEMSAHRSELSAQRTYMNTERTLSVWIRTAMAAMIFGIAIDRLGLLFHEPHHVVNLYIIRGSASTLTGAILIIFSMFMAVSAALRFIKFSRHYKTEHTFPAHHKPLLPIVYTAMIVIFGMVLLLLIVGVF